MPFSVIDLFVLGASGLGLAGLCFLIMANNDQRFFSLFLIYVSVTIVLSQIYLANNPVFVTETGKTSTPNAAYLTYIFFNLMFFAGIGIVGYFQNASSSSRFWRPPAPNERLIALSLVSGILALQLINVFLAYPNGFSGVRFNRGLFFELYAPIKILPVLFGNLAFFIPVVAAALLFTSWTTSQRIICGSLLILYFVFMKGTGQVFNGMILPGSIIFGIYLVFRHNGRVSFAIPIKTIALVGGTAIAIGMVSNFADRGISVEAGGAIGGIIYRIFVLQGSASKEIYDLWLAGNSMRFSDLFAGRDYWIFHTMPSTLANEYLANGVNLQGAVPGTFLLYGGFVGGSVLCLVYGVLVGVVNGMMFAAIRQGALLALFPCSYLWLWAIGIYSRASLEELLEPKAIVMIVAYLALYWWSVYRNNPYAYEPPPMAAPVPWPTYNQFHR